MLLCYCVFFFAIKHIQQQKKPPLKVPQLIPTNKPLQRKEENLPQLHEKCVMCVVTSF